MPDQWRGEPLPEYRPLWGVEAEEWLYRANLLADEWPEVWLERGENERRSMYAPRHRWVSDR